MKIVRKIEHIKGVFQLSCRAILQLLNIPSSTYRRWKSRISRYIDPVCQPGPKPIKPLDLQEVMGELKKLRHRTKRSLGVDKLRETLRESISRRDLDRLVLAARKENTAANKASLFEVHWLQPGAVWAMDVFEMKLPRLPSKAYGLTVQDLASSYKLPPLATERVPRGPEVAAHLESLFTRFNKPLFLKLDNGGNLNECTVKALLADQHIIPLNSPTYYAPYNGAIEHAQREFKERIQERCSNITTFHEFAVMVELAAHDLNHSARRKLDGKNSCREFFRKVQIRYSKRKRKEVVGWISDLAVDIAVKSGENKISPVAWRVACRRWLEENDLVSICKRQRVLPTFSGKLAHN